MGTKRGFTIIELIIAIGLLALLASVVIFITNPLERVKEKHDQRLHSDTETILDGIISFYISQGHYPWSTGIDSTDVANPLPWQPIITAGIGLCENEDCSKKGILARENKIPSGLPIRYAAADKADTIYIGKGRGAKAPVYACFVPISKAERKKTGGLYKINVNTDFPLTGAIETCPATITWEEEDVCYLCVAR